MSVNFKYSKKKWKKPVLIYISLSKTNSSPSEGYDGPSGGS
jgi:hypothetical protein